MKLVVTAMSGVTSRSTSTSSWKSSSSASEEKRSKSSSCVGFTGPVARRGASMCSHAV